MIRSSMELHDEMQRKLMEKAEVERELHAAQRAFMCGDDPSDPDWISDQHDRIRALGRIIQRLQLESAQARRREKQQDSKRYEAERAAQGLRFGREFMNQAKLIMTGAQYNQLIEATKAVLGEDQP